VIPANRIISQRPKITLSDVNLKLRVSPDL
jgi:hypothetical protein